MRAVIQRVKESTVSVEDEVISKIGAGLLVFIGIARGDRSSDAEYLAEKISNLRIFEDDAGKMNRSLLENGGQMLVVSQFTLLGDCRKGRRPSFVQAAPPDTADRLYENFTNMVREKGIAVQTGRFRAMMSVSLINDGPVTLIVESPQAEYS
jgi:D-tyrosyl-tRNA(Tyr) deacylase